ncbi:MAG: GDP-L-fucose synthase [Candidatus Omnitrophica bacterium ADurb.Bin292]|jgi:GDP-L-fucose synthase|nr:MAG: GDP-L-fucose synthase [Candidatus Omnitrophica bacterium ADurb.Bin292]HQB12566.1 GDP-L-fucose synthase [Candidatus Omnitrophota bacterium]
MDTKEKIYIAGHRGLVGSAILRCLEKNGYRNFVTRTHRELDLTDQAAVEAFFNKEKPAYVFLAAAKVGGIYANMTQGATFIYENLAIQTNVIHAAYRSGVKKLLFLGSSCIYPKLAPQPLKEEYLLTGPLESTNEPYAIAKIAGIKMCEAYHRQYGVDFLAVMPTNLYGPNDNFDAQASHVLPALIRKIHEAKVGGRCEVPVWGTGAARREFLFSEDMAEACVLIMQKCTAQDLGSIVNIGCGKDITINELVHIIAKVIGYEGMFVYDRTKPDGTPQKLLDISKITGLGWKPRILLEEGIRAAYAWYCANVSTA